MKKRLLAILSMIALLLTGCETETVNIGEDKPEIVDSNVTEETVQIESMVEKETENNNIDPAQLLIDKYGGYQNSDMIPMVGELFSFRYTDVIKSVEDIGADPSGTFVLIQFEDSNKDIILLDVSRTAEYTEEIEKKIFETKEAMQLLGSTPIVEESPQVGEEKTYSKNFLVAEVEDTGLTYNENRLYTVKSESGLEVLVSVAKYVLGPYDPKVQEIINFRVEDKVTSVEPIYGAYTAIHFENKYNDMVVYDKSNENAESGNGDVLAIKESLNQKEIESPSYYVEKLPQVGAVVSYEKSCEIINVTLEKEDDKYKYFIIEGAGGIQDKWMVPKSMILTNSTWQYGTLNENEYQNDSFGIKVDLSNIDINDINVINYAERRFALCRTTKLSGEDWSIYFNLYEFEDNITEDAALSALQSSRTYLSETIVDDQVIAGKTYHTISLIGFSGYETCEWYRVEDNRLYLLRIEGFADKNSILAMIQE